METKSLSERIKQKRKATGLTQARLAELLGISEMTVRRWESEKTSPRMDELRQIAEVLGTTPEDLLNNNTDENDLFTEQLPTQVKKSPFRKTEQYLVYERNGERMELPPTEESYAIFRDIAAMIAKREASQPAMA